MILFPPRDVSHLSFAPGASSSSLDVFMSLDGTTNSGGLSGTHPHEVHFLPGDMLLIPSTWPHTAAPSTNEVNVAVNVFFRDLKSDVDGSGNINGGVYAPGRDVYGNRDLAAYEKARVDVAKMVKGFEKLPGGVGEFYLRRIADEIRDAAGEVS
jgi:tRNA wybutosine-synthesizing protein 4